MTAATSHGEVGATAHGRGASGPPDRTPSAAPDRAAVMAQAGSENFPVASRLLGRRERRHLMALYGFARLVDDIGDEDASGPPEEREQLLGWLEHELDTVFAGGRPDHPVMARLAETLAIRPLPDGPFRRLIEANRRDQVVVRYRTFDELLDYCQLSAAPVGELVLHVFGAATPERVALSDRICAGLQVLEHIQDIGEDYRRGRVYMPAQDMQRFGCQETELGAPSAGPAVRSLVAFEIARARSLLGAGAPLAATLPLRARLAVAGFLAGGRSALDAIERAGCETLCAVPRPTRRAFLSQLLNGVRGR